MSGELEIVKLSELPSTEAPSREGRSIVIQSPEGTITLAQLLQLARASDVKIDPPVPGLEGLKLNVALAEIANPSFLFGPRTIPTLAVEDAGEIACDLQNGARLFFTRTMADDETLAAPANAPVGATFYLLVDPGAHTLSFVAGYEGPGNQLPNIEGESLLAIVVAGAARFLVHVVGSDYGDGS